MATVIARYEYADGDVVTVSVEVENDYPDCIREALVTAISGVCDLTGIGAAAGDDDDG